MPQIQKQTSEVRTSQRESDQEQRIFSFKATQWIWLVLGLIEALIAMRIILLLIGANAASPFAVFIYGVTNIFLFPFAGLVGTPTSGAMVLELSSIIAMLVYALLFWALERIVWVTFYRPRGSAVDITQTTTSESAPVSVRHTPTREQNDV